MSDMLFAPQNPAPSPGSPQAPQPPQAVIPGNAGNVVALQAQLGDLSIQASSLRATLRGLNRQLNAMRIDNPARAGLQQQAADVGAQLARVEGKIAEIQGRIAQAQGVSPDRITEQGTLMPPQSSPAFRRGVDPDMIVGMSFVLAMCLVLPLSIGFARRVWRGGPKPAAPITDQVLPRLDRLEQAVDSVAIEIERISENQRFVTRILAERAAAPAPAAPAGQGVEESRSPLALGAGPAEPIRVEQGVKQGINQR